MVFKSQIKQIMKECQKVDMCLLNDQYEEQEHSDIYLEDQQNDNENEYEQEQQEMNDGQEFQDYNLVQQQFSDY